MILRYSDGEYRMIADATPIANSPTLSGGQSMMNVSRNIQKKWCSMAILIAFAAMLAVCISPVCIAEDWGSWSSNKSIQ